MTSRPRWALVALVLAVAAAIALWPRDGAVEPPANSIRQEPDLTAAQARAALRQCPQPSGATAASGPLRGVTATCLGDSSVVDLGAALAGHPALINVWASWCQPCREELPILEAYAGTAGAIQVLGVQVQSDPKDGLVLLASLSVHFPSVLDSTDTVSRALQLPNYLPVSYVVQPGGTVRQVQPPTPFASIDEVHATLDRYLDTASK